MPMLFVPDIGRPQQKVILGVIYKYGKKKTYHPIPHHWNGAKNIKMNIFT